MPRKGKEKRAIWFKRPGDEWGLLTNFAHTPFILDGRTWPTIEHYFQAGKATNRIEFEKIAGAPSPMAAKTLGRQANLRSDWKSVKETVMLAALRAKFSQHSSSRSMLLATGNRPLHEDAYYDKYWGGDGKDRLGKLLMQVRAELLGSSKR